MFSLKPRPIRSLLAAVLTGSTLILAAGVFAADPTPTQNRVDLRPEFASHGIAVRQQGKRGACQVFAMVGTIEFLLAKEGHPADLSEQFLMWAANQTNGLDRTEGFNPDLLIKGLRQHGICAESLMAYVPRNEPLGEPQEAAIRDARTRALIEVDTIQHWTAPIGFGDEVLEALINRLDRGIPVTVTLCWPFGLTDEEIVDSGNFLIDRAIDGNDKSGHGVVFVGYARDSAVPGGGYFLLRNSWGEGFAEAGHAKVSFAMSRKYGIDAYVVSIAQAE